MFGRLLRCARNYKFVKPGVELKALVYAFFIQAALLLIKSLARILHPGLTPVSLIEKHPGSTQTTDTRSPAPHSG